MILTRHGNKRKIADKIIPYFPEHKIYVEPFFGAGGMYFSKPLAKYSILNDIDEDVFNLWMIVQNNPDAIYNYLLNLPYHDMIFHYFRKDKSELSDIERAARYLYVQLTSFMGKGGVMRFGANNSKKIVLDRIHGCYEALQPAQLMSVDFRDVLRKISIKNERERETAFIYADPPYLGTMGYGTKWNKDDVDDLFAVLINSGMKFVMSEFDNDYVLNIANENKLKVVEIGERRNLGNRRVEIIIKNY